MRPSGWASGWRVPACTRLAPLRKASTTSARPMPRLARSPGSSCPRWSCLLLQFCRVLVGSAPLVWRPTDIDQPDTRESSRAGLDRVPGLVLQPEFVTWLAWGQGWPADEGSRWPLGHHQQRSANRPAFSNKWIRCGRRGLGGVPPPRRPAAGPDRPAGHRAPRPGSVPGRDHQGRDARRPGGDEPALAGGGCSPSTSPASGSVRVRGRSVSRRVVPRVRLGSGGSASAGGQV